MKIPALVAYLTLATTILAAASTVEPYTFRITNRTAEQIHVAMAMRNGNEFGSTNIPAGESGRLVFRHLPELLDVRAKNCRASVAVPPSSGRDYFAIVNVINGHCEMHI